eukprot:7741276-Pyramimonas_sp.AAC.1
MVSGGVPCPLSTCCMAQEPLSQLKEPPHRRPGDRRRDPSPASRRRVPRTLTSGPPEGVPPHAREF